MDKRNTVNLLLVGAAGLPIGGLALPYLTFFVPPRCVPPPLHPPAPPIPIVAPPIALIFILFSILSTR